ncbi:MAG TPA: hypothetical protein VFE30_05245 [Anaeromyxobacteraceae bacterium]|jgi:hypothetical protein|nr:hypothetical protein [Anaeromyxobacteraceae bacterium]
MTHRLAIALLLLPLTASAGPQPAAAGANQGEEARYDRFSKRLKLARILGLSEALDLNEGEAIKFRDVMARFDERRKPLIKELRDAARTVHRAAEGDKDAAGQADQAVQRIFEAREKMHAIDRDLYQALAKDLSPARRARLAVFFAQFHQRMGKMMMEHRVGLMGGMGAGGHGAGMHGGRGPMGGQMGMGGPGPGAGPEGDGGDDLFGEQ